MSDLSELKVTLKHLSTCLSGVSYIETKYGGIFKKGNREIYCNANFKDNNKPVVSEIKRRGGKFCVDVGRRDVCNYGSIKQTVKRGLGCK